MKIVQVLDALDYGDGVSNDVINKKKLLQDLGYETEIYSKWYHENMAFHRKDIKKLHMNKNDILLHHFSGESSILSDIFSLPCKKVLVYHNITPWQYFKSKREEEHCRKGEQQLKQIHERYNFFVGVSYYNIQGLRQIGIKKEADILPIYIDFSRLEPFRLNRHSKDNSSIKTFLFVGRVVPNKMHRDVIDIFSIYHKSIDRNSRLLFVGNYMDYMDYFQELQEYCILSDISEHVYFKGKISDEALYSTYAESDIFLCMSEHEGFCIPLLESMYMGIPTIAYDAGAVASTMGDAGVLVKEKNFEQLSRLCYILLENIQIRQQVIDKQHFWVESFSKENIKQKLLLLINKWSGGAGDE